MAYFFLSTKLLTEASFLRTVARIHEAFIAADKEEYEFFLARDISFELSVQSWIRKCEDKKTFRIDDDGVMYVFKSFAARRLRAYIAMDVDNFVREFREGKHKDSKPFFQEAEAIRLHIESAKYLAPVRDELTSALDGIAIDVETTKQVELIKPVVEGNDVLFWNGSVASLITLFHDLRTQKDSTSGKVYLDYIPSQLEEFIFRHFRDRNGDEIPRSTIKTYLDPNREDKKAKKGRIKTSNTAN